jgi:hypothetical protein
MRIARVLACVGALTIAFSATALAQGNKGKIALIPQGGLTLPIGDFAETEPDLERSGGATAGFAGGATVEYFVTNNVAVGGIFTYNRFGFDDVGFVEILEGLGATTAELDGNWSVVDFGAFVKYYFTPDRPTQFFGRAGAVFGKAKLTGDFALAADGIGEVTGDGEADMKMAPGAEIAVGVLHEVKENISIFGEAAFTHRLTDGKEVTLTLPDPLPTVFPDLAEPFDGEGNSQWFTFKGGVVFFFQP